jgi:serine/threonine-protein kinase
LHGKGVAIKTCVKCKADYRDDVNFCPRCGTALVERESKPGDLIGGAYRIVKSIGDGWASTVYRAEHAMMGRPTALKITTSAAVGESGFMERYREAAHLLSDLSHQRIVTVHDMGVQAPDSIYIASEFVNGKTVGGQLAECAYMDPQRVLDITRAVLNGLRAAHAIGVVHGSIKPANVIVPTDGSGPRILDFGARRIVRALQDDSFTVETPYGPLYGETAYLSPEQVRGETASETSDIYNLGLLMYEMLTGISPFAGETPGDVARAQVEKEPVPVGEAQPGIEVPRFIEKTVMRALSKDPSERQQTAGELADELQGEIVSRKAPASSGSPTVIVAKPRGISKTLAKPPAASKTPAKAAARLVRYKGRSKVGEFPVDKETILIGRSSECDIVLDDAGVSRVHAKITVKVERTIVEDLDSLNGTFINEDAVKRGHIEDGYKISLGSADLIYRTD